QSMVGGTRLDTRMGVNYSEAREHARRVIGGNPENNFETEIWNYVHDNYLKFEQEVIDNAASGVFEELLTTPQGEERSMRSMQDSKEAFAIGKITELGH